MEYGNSIIIEFDMLYDIDVGIFKLIKTSYNNPEYINQYINDISINNFKYMMLNADVYDPVKICVKEEYESTSSELLNDMLNTEYSSILKLSEHTNVAELMAVYMKTSLVKISILCSNEEEKTIIENNPLLSNIPIIIEDDYSKVDLSGYDSIFIKKYKDILKFKKVQGKSIFIGNYKFNKEESNDNKIVPLTEVTILIGDVNRIYFIDNYILDDSYPIYG